MTTGSPWLVGAMASLCLVAARADAQTSSPQTSSPQATPPQSSAPKAVPTKAVSHWGVLFAATPSWYIPTSITNTFAGDGGSAVVVGSQFAIGIVHGRSMGGDWGVTFVHQRVKDGSRGSDSDTECGFTNGPLPGGCFNTSGGAVTQGVTMNGVQVHKFFSFGVIKRRVQIGLEIAGGIAGLSGTLQKTSSDVTNVQTNPNTHAMTAILTTTITDEDITAELPGKVPLGHVSVVGALVVTPSIKLRWEGGFLMPGQSFSTVIVTYLFGAHD